MKVDIYEMLADMLKSTEHNLMTSEAALYAAKNLMNH